MTASDYGVLWSVQELMETQVQEVEEVARVGRGSPAASRARRECFSPGSPSPWQLSIPLAAAFQGTALEQLGLPNFSLYSLPPPAWGPSGLTSITGLRGSTSDTSCRHSHLSRGVTPWVVSPSRMVSPFS